MKVILAVDAIKLPLTGIGRYAWELANRIPTVPDVDSTLFFSRGRWISEVGSLLEQSPAALAFKRRLVPGRLARAAYRLLSPPLLRRRLRAFPDHLFHGPNFYLPPCSGPAIATIHDLSIFRFPQFHLASRVDSMRREFPVILDRADFLITDSEFIRREVIDFFGWPEDKVRAVPLGVPEEFRPRGAEETAAVMAKFGLSYGSYALCVATIEPRKNIEGLLSAYEALPQALRNRYPLVLAGDRGWRSESIHRRIERGQRQGWLRYLGYVSEAELPLLYAGGRGFVFPSLYEGFGLPVLEAMASGLPALCSNCSSLPEVASGATLLVEPEDARAMTEGIRKLLEDEEWRNAAARRALVTAAQYTWEKTARDTVEVYRAVLGA